MNKPLTNITESATGLISFDFMGVQRRAFTPSKDKDNTPHPPTMPLAAISVPWTAPRASKRKRRAEHG